jgi:very-short-patch-repair endonuclease
MITSAIRPELTTAVNSADLVLIQAFPVAVLVGTLVLWTWSGIHLALKRRRRDAAGVRRPFMSRHEIEFARLLKDALPGCHIQAKVALSVLLDDITVLRRHLVRDVVDFLVQDAKTGEVIALIEFDDRRAAVQRDHERDLQLLQAGYRLIRFDLFDWPPSATIAIEVLGYLPLGKPPPQFAGGCQVIQFPERLSHRAAGRERQSTS